MNQKKSQTSAFVLHARAYQENSQIIQFFSLELGRFSAIAKGIKGKRSQARKATLQPFSQLSIEYIGRGDLKTLTHCEVDNQVNFSLGYILRDKALACGYYANELLLRALPEYHDYPDFFHVYHQFIDDLKTKNEILFGLRNFEVALLTTIGLAPDWQYTIDGEAIDKDEYYCFIPQSGFQRASLNDLKSNYYSGQAILSLASGEYFSDHIKASQQITRLLLSEVIGNKPLQSRKLWQHINLNKS